MVPYGSQFYLFPSYISYRKSFFHLKLPFEIGFFETSDFFIVWMVDGGWYTEAILDVKKNNVFGNISETTRRVFLIVSASNRRFLKTFSEKTSKKNKIFILYKKFRTNFFSEISPFFEVCSRVDLVNI